MASKLKFKAAFLFLLVTLLLTGTFVQQAQAQPVEEEYEEDGMHDMDEYEDEEGDFGKDEGMGYDDFGGLDGLDGMGDYGEQERELSPEDHIRGFIELDDMTFDKFVPVDRPALVEFYAPWCGHCRTLASELDMLGTVFGEHRRLNLVKVNADEYGALAERFKIEGFPTLKFFDMDGTIEDVEGRQMDELADYLWSKVGKVTFLPELESHLKSFLSNDNDNDRNDAISQAEVAVAELEDSKAKTYGDVYLRIMRSILKKGDDYVQKEKARIEGMIQKDLSALSEKKVQEFAYKIEILEIFDKMEL